MQAGDRFPKTAFALDWEAGTIRCPNGVTRPFAVGGTVQFPAAGCAACPLRARCTGSAQGRSVAIHPDERLLQELRERQHTPAGRAKLRERVASELKTTFASRYTRSVSLPQALQLDAIAAYGRRSTGEKYLITPNA